MNKPRCPKCSSFNVSGLMASFWVKLDDEGMVRDEWAAFQSETELTEERLCESCGHEWQSNNA